MSKKISWLEKFAEDQALELKKTASLNKKASQVIVDCDDCPDAKVGAEVTYKNERYKVVQTDFQDELGAGIILEKVADEDMSPVDGEETMDMPIEATAELQEETLPVAEAEAEVAKTEVAEVPETEVTKTEVPETEVPVAEVAEVAANAQELAYTNPGNIYHIEVGNTEIDNFQAAATETEQAIASENTVDRTTVPGYYTRNKNRILDRMMADYIQVEEPVVEEPTVEEPVVEKPVVEEPVVEEPTVEEKNVFSSNSILKKMLKNS